MAAANAERTKEQMNKASGGDELMAAVMSMLGEMRTLRAEVDRHETSLQVRRRLRSD